MNKLLLIDGSMTTQRVVELIFENEDVDVYLASSGSEGIEKIKLKKPDIVLVSAKLPDADGYELCRIMKTEPGGEGVPFILLTDEASGFDQSRDEGAVFDGYIEKPFDSVSLLRLVRKYLPIRDPAPEPEKREAPSPDRGGIESADIIVEGVEVQMGEGVESDTSDAEEVEAEVDEDIRSTIHDAEETEADLGGEIGEEQGREEVEVEEPPQTEKVDTADGESLFDEFQERLKSLAEEVWTDMERSAKPAGAETDRESEAPPLESARPPDSEEVEQEALQGEGAVTQEEEGGTIEIERIAEEEVKRALSSVEQPEPSPAIPPDIGESEETGRDAPQPAGTGEGSTLIFLQNAFEALSHQVMETVKKEVRTLFPALAEKIIREEIEKIKRGDDK